MFTAQQELDLGDVEAELLEKNYRVIHDDELAARLNRISNRILEQPPHATEIPHHPDRYTERELVQCRRRTDPWELLDAFHRCRNPSGRE